MLLGPIFSLELLTCARRARYYLLRTIYALVLLFTLWVTYESAQARRPFSGIHGVANVAKDFFQAFGILQVLTILLLGPAMVAGTIAQERERRTIEYLFTSQLSNTDIVLGKLGARLLNMALLLVAGIPVLALAMLLGGIPPAALLSVSLLTLETLAAVGSLSILVSVGRRRTRDAVIAAYLLLVAVLLMPMMGWGLIQVPTVGFWGSLARLVGSISEPVAQMNPFYVLATTNTSSPTGDSLALRLARVFACYAGFSVACLALAIFSLRRSYARAEGRGAVRRRFSFPAWRPEVWKRPLVWKEMFIEPAMGRLGWLGRLAIALLLLSFIVPWAVALADILLGGGPSNFIYTTVMAACCLECFGLLMIAARAATCVTSEKERDCWVALLSTPLSAREIVGGKLLGNLYAVRWVAALVLVFWAGAVIVEPAFVLAVPVQLATWALLLVYASWLGIAFSQWCRTSLRSMGAALGLGLFAGGLYLPFAGLLLEVFNRNGSRGMEFLILTPCVPYLLAFPAMFWAEQLDGGNFDRSGVSMVAYVLGMLGYGFATSLLWTMTVSRFNQLAGRMSEPDRGRPEIYERDDAPAALPEK